MVVVVVVVQGVGGGGMCRVAAVVAGALRVGGVVGAGCWQSLLWCTAVACWLCFFAGKWNVGLRCLNSTQNRVVVDGHGVGKICARLGVLSEGVEGRKCTKKQHSTVNSAMSCILLCCRALVRV